MNHFPIALLCCFAIINANNVIQDINRGGKRAYCDVEHNHFCHNCEDEHDALDFSKLRNKNCEEVEGKTTDTNTVFVASVGGMKWNNIGNGKWCGVSKVTTYQCEHLNTDDAKCHYIGNCRPDPFKLGSKGHFFHKEFKCL